MEALGAYVLANKRLPCPAVNTNGDAQTTCTNGANIGFVPFRTLGIMEKTAKDGRHHWLTYAVQPNLASGRISYLQPPELAMDPKTIFCATNADGPLAMHNCKNESCITAPDFAAVIIISHGTSGGYYLENGTAQPVDSTDPDKLANSARGGAFVTKIARHNGSNIFDDIILFASRNNFMAQWAKCPCQRRD